MPLVGRMRLAGYFFPVAVVWEEGVGLGRGVVDLSETQAVGLADELAVEARPTYYIYMLVGVTGGNEVIPCAEALAAGQ